MLSSLIHPGDWWLLIPSSLAILTLGLGRLQILGLVLLLATTIVISNGYGLLRAAIHLVLCIAFAKLLRIFSLRFVVASPPKS